jgi:hypothetical protein
MLPATNPAILDELAALGVDPDAVPVYDGPGVPHDERYMDLIAGVPVGEGIHPGSVV